MPVKPSDDGPIAQKHPGFSRLSNPEPAPTCTLQLGASSLIMVHNHPSGDPTPSQADIDMTREVQAAAEVLGISLHDHVVIGRKGHASFKSMRLI